MVKLARVIGFILSAVFMFIVPLWYLINKYSRVKVVEATTKTVMPIPILIFIMLLIIIIAIALAVWLFAMWLKSATKSKASFAFLAPFGIAEFGLAWAFRILLIKVKLLIESNVAQFLQDLAGYTYSLGVVMIWVGVGLSIGIISVLSVTVMEYKKTT